MTKENLKTIYKEDCETAKIKGEQCFEYVDWLERYAISQRTMLELLRDKVSAKKNARIGKGENE